MNVNIFRGYQSTQPEVITVEQMVNLIKSDPNLAELTRRYRITHDHKYKSQCPCFSVTCIFQGGKAKKDIVEVKDISLADFDHAPVDKLPEMLAKLRADEHVWLAYTTVSGEGIRVLYRYEKKEGMTLQEQIKFYPLAFTHGNEYFAHLLGMEYDEHCSNLGRLTGAAYDPQVYFNPQAKPFAYDWLVAQGEQKAKADKHATQLRREVKKIGRLYDDVLSRELRSEGKDYVAGKKNEYVSCLAYKLNAFGFSAESALAFIQQDFPDYERPKAAVESCYRQTEEHGKRKMPSHHRGESKVASVQEIIQFLDAHVHLRFNEITTRVEYLLSEEGRVKSEESCEKSQEWQVITDRTVNTLWSEMSKTTRANVQDFFRVIDSNYVKPFNPFKDYLASLPEWKEGDPDYIQQLADTVTIVGGAKHQALWSLYLKKWLVGMVAGWIKVDVVNNVILVLIGEQGCGKSTLFAMFLPPELQKYFYTKTNAKRLSKDDLIVLATYGLVLCEELDTMTPSELNQLKAAVTMLTIDERAAYAHYTEHRYHIASFAATGNNAQFLSDPTGNRRWLPFEVSEIRSPRDYPIDYPHVYAQAYHLLNSGYRYWFSKAEIKELNRHNHQFETPRQEEELVSLYFAKPSEEHTGVFMTASRALQIIGTGISQKLSSVNVGRAFTDLGFQKVRVNHSWGYLVVERDGNEIKAFQQRLAVQAQRGEV